MLESPTSARSLEGVYLDVILKLKDLCGVGGEVELKMTERNRVHERRWHRLTDSPLHFPTRRGERAFFPDSAKSKMISDSTYQTLQAGQILETNPR